MSRKYFALLSVLIIMAMVLGACGPAATDVPDEAVAEEEAAPQEAEEPEMAEEPTAEPFTIGVSNPFISSEYRTQMIAELIEVNQEYM
ncbi:MAG: hypothetical protein JXA25_15850, partial [Anaerolineales bacterium]|nr:hypothetical protein [Anaerolineales bacterium]